MEEIVENNFEDKVINSNIPVLVDFSAQDCIPCRQTKKVLNHMAKRINGSCKIVSIDVKKQEKISSKYNIMALPTLIIFRNGKPIARKSGAMPPSILQQWISDATKV